jgi:hypothetical protein
MEIAYNQTELQFFTSIFKSHFIAFHIQALYLNFISEIAAEEHYYFHV